MDPVTASIIIGAIGSGFSGAGNAAGGRAQAKSNERIARMDDATKRQQLQLAESGMDPFRQLMYQGSNLGRIDMMRGNNAPSSSIAPTGRYATTGAPTMTGQGAYKPSPELMQWLMAIQQNIAGGQNPAQSVTGARPNVMNLLDPATMANPSQARGPGASQMPQPDRPELQQYGWS